MSQENTDPTEYLSDELESLAATVRYQRWIAEQFAPFLEGRVVEVGAGIGTMSRYWLPLVEELHLIEPAHNLFAQLQRRFGKDPKVRLCRDVLEGFIRADTIERSGSFDAIVMVNVLEHIADDVETLRTAHALLKRDGRLLIFVPALPALYGSLDEKFGHFRRYTKSSLASVAIDAQLDIVRLRYFDFLGAAPWWAMNRVFRARTIGRTAAVLYDRIAVPICRACERLVEPPLGKNLILVARK